MLTGQSLPETADLVNRFLCTRQVGKYATMILLKVFHNGCVEYMNCGHIPPLLIASSGSRYLEEANLIVGIIADATYKSAQFTLQPGDRILLTTDGITETEDKTGQLIGIDGLARLAELPGIDSIVEQMAQIRKTAEAKDDWTLIDIRYRGK
jgi:serine phosphatase RsbU (regulator of sigma subunit)